MFLSFRDWDLPPLNGVTTAPLLSDDGSIRIARGRDAKTGLFCGKFQTSLIAFPRGQLAKTPRDRSCLYVGVFGRFHSPTP